jgi:hypothetical protein
MNSFGLHYQGKDRFVVRAGKELELQELWQSRELTLIRWGPLKELKQ